MQKVGHLTYKLDVPPNWQIHPVFFVAQLETASPPAKDLFERPFPSNFPPIFVEGDTNRVKSFEIEKLLNKYQVKKGKGRAIEYLVCWKSYGPEWDGWYNLKELDNATAFITNYKASLATTSTYFINKDIDFFS